MSSGVGNITVSISFDREKFMEKALLEFSLEELDKSLSDEELNEMLNVVLSKYIEEIVSVDGNPIKIR